MKRPQRTKTRTRAAGAPKATKPKTLPAKSESGLGGDTAKALALIRKNPGIRPSELNRLLHRVESDGLRATLIKRGLIRKEVDGAATRYYPV
jgi:hypothetical protein